MTKQTLRTLLRLTYFPSMIIPVVMLAVAFFFDVQPSLGVVFAMMALAGAATILATPTIYPSVNWDNALPKRSNAFPLMALCVAPLSYLVPSLGESATEAAAMASLNMVMYFMVTMLVSMIAGIIFGLRMSKRYKDEYAAYRKEKTAEALTGELQSLAATLPPMYANYVKAQLKDATPEKVAEVAKAIETIQADLPHMLKNS